MSKKELKLQSSLTCVKCAKKMHDDGFYSFSPKFLAALKKEKLELQEKISNELGKMVEKSKERREWNS